MKNKTKKIADDSHVNVTGTSRDNTCRHVPDCDKSRVRFTLRCNI